MRSLPLPGTRQWIARLDYRRPDARAAVTWASVGLRLSLCPAAAWVARPVLSLRKVQRDRITRSPPRSRNTSTPGGTTRLPARRSCAVGHPEPPASSLPVGHFRSNAGYLAGVAPSAGGKTLDVSPRLTGSTAHQRPDIRACLAPGKGEPEMGLPPHPG